MVLRKVEKRLREIETFVYFNVTPIKDIACFEVKEHLAVEEAINSRRFRPCQIGRSWGSEWGTAWFRLRFRIPADLAGHRAIARIHTGGEALAFLNGAPLQGLDKNRDAIVLLDRARGGEAFELHIESAADNHWGVYRGKSRLEKAEVCTINPKVWDCFLRMKFLHQLAQELPETSARRHQIEESLNHAVDAFDYDHATPLERHASAVKAMRVLSDVLKAPAEVSMPTVHVTGQSHIDVAWLWPIRETIRKCGRTFSTALKYMDEYPDYHFTQSQPLLYAFIKERYPSLHEKVKARVAEGRWEPIGGMWVEPDCNLVSGESLVRQFLHGLRFFEEEFGVSPQCVWIPDAFGFTAALPQIIRKCGMRYFTTVKMSWNDTNRFPYSTFRWRGIDGSEVLAHLSPADTCNGYMIPKELLLGLRNLHRNGGSRDFLYHFGYGDGGGGPTPEMLENTRIGANLEGLPRLKTSSAESFFRHIEAGSGQLPVWVGELYLEFHRGVYTSQARTKQLNRQSEIALRGAELLASASWLEGGEYPREELDRAWKVVLTNQFHDILPGSSIRIVHEEGEKAFQQALKTIETLADRSRRQLLKSIDTRGKGTPVVVWNELSWARNGVVEVPVPGREGHVHVVDPAGNAVASEIRGRGTKKLLRFRAQSVPGIGHSVYRIIPEKKAAPVATLKADPRHLENDFLRVSFDRNGLITSMIDKSTGMESIPAGQKANLLQLFEDKPVAWDAWDINLFYQDKGTDLVSPDSVEVVSQGPIEAALRIVRSFGKSRIEQVVALGAGSMRLEFRTRVEWREKQRMLKALFPTTINSGAPARATFGIQFGHLERSTHRNTSWDVARFEQCAHKWADLSDGGHGMALLNDCKYGCDIHDHCMRLTLLRAPIHPDPEADQGEHTFTYALFPHVGDFRAAGVIQEAEDLNAPLTAVVQSRHKGSHGPREAWMRVDVPNVVIEAVKKAEASDDLIIRLYEAHNATARATITMPKAMRRVSECDLLEREQAELPFSDREIVLNMKPFEIKTLKIEFLDE